MPEAAAANRCRLVIDEDRRAHSLVLAIFALPVAFIFGIRPSLFRDGDVSWHLAAGKWILEHRKVPMEDPFSYTAFGQPWVAHEWLAELLMALAFEQFSYAGLAILVALSFSLTILTLGLRLRRWASPVELCLALMLISLALAPFTVARPMVLVWPLLAFWTSEMLRARDEDRAPSWWLLPLMTLWINMHASFVFGLFLTGVFAFEALIQSETRLNTFARWSAFGFASLAAALLNPHGLSGVLFPFYILNSPVVEVINEFRPTTFSEWPAFEVAVLVTLGVGLWRGARLPAARILLLLLILHLGMTHARHQPILLIIAGLVVVPVLMGSASAGAGPKRALLAGAAPWRRAATIGAAVAAFCIIAAARTTWLIEPPESRINPVTAFARIPDALRDKPVLNDYALGGPLILRGVPVYIDGRSDLYGDEAVLNYAKIDQGDAREFEKADRRWRFCWSIFPAGNRPIFALLDDSKEWRRAYEDKFAVIHIRRTCLPPG